VEISFQDSMLHAALIVSISLSTKLLGLAVEGVGVEDVAGKVGWTLSSDTNFFFGGSLVGEEHDVNIILKISNILPRKSVRSPDYGIHCIRSRFAPLV
jgi:hypothetical protein